MWTDSSVFYQIYPLGAVGAPFENDHQKEHRLQKLKNYIPQLKELGINAILLNPVFQSSTHGYDTMDYSKVDDRLGDNTDLKDLVDAFHKNGMRVILDGVFNHVGRDFIPFQDVLKNRESSPYKDWFNIDFNGNNSYNDGLYYQNWEGYDALVKLNLKNPEVVQYLLDTVSKWKEEFGIDGLRLDVAYCLDPDFLRALHSHTKAMDPDFFLLGETLHGDYNQWVNDSMLDSCTNYECYKGLYSALNSKNLFEIVHSLNRQFGKENWCLYRGKHLLAFVDNHDVNRIATQLENKNLLPLIYTLMFGMPGIPCIYYGSEWGIEGVKQGNDAEIRPEIESLQSNELTEFIKKLIEIKKEHTALHNGEYAPIVLQNEYAVIERKNNDETLWIGINIKDQPVDAYVDFDGQAKNLLNGCEETMNHSIHFEPYEAKILQL